MSNNSSDEAGFEFAEVKLHVICLCISMCNGGMTFRIFTNHFKAVALTKEQFLADEILI